MTDGKFWGFPAYGQRGIYSALVEPMRSRNIRFHLFRRSHKSEGNAVLKKNDKGETIMEVVKELAVKFEFIEVPEGELPEKPTIDGNWETGELQDFLQAVVDCAFMLGIVAKQQTDNKAELQATVRHLEDMRTLALRQNSK